MRREFVAVTGWLVVTMTLAMSLAGCAGRPNDLRHRDDPARPATSAVTTGGVGPSATSSMSATASQDSPADRAKLAILSQRDVAGEGVAVDRAASPTSTVRLPDCAAAAPAGSTAPAMLASWRYPSGSSLRQYVLAYSTGAASAVATIDGALGCSGFVDDGTEQHIAGRLALADDGSDARVAWCSTGQANTSCTVASAKGRLLSVVIVSAASEQRAAAAIKRLAPVADAALSHAS